MEENEYRQTYESTIPQRCVFEKGILARKCNCSLARRCNLAEREAVACESGPSQNRCAQWLEQLREKAAFALQLPEMEGAFSPGPVPRSPLPHNKEMKIQIGGLLGLAQALSEDGQEAVKNVNELLDRAMANWGDWAQVPFQQIVRAVSHYQGRARRRSKP